MYAIIQFTDKDGGTVSIVNKQWLTPRRCEVYWPPVKGTKAFNRILDQDATPDDKWKLYGVQKVFYETDNIDKAKKKLKLVEDTSDLQTEEEAAHSPKRRRKPKRYISSEEEENYDNHMRPPALKKKFITSTTSIQDIRQAQPNEEISLIPEKNQESYNDSLSLLNVDNLPLLTSSILQGLADETEEISPAQPAGSPQSRHSSLSVNNSASALSLCAQTGHSPLRPFDGRRLHFGGGASTSTSPACSRVRTGLDRQPNLNSGVTESLSCVAQLTGYQSKVLSLLTVIKTQNEQIMQMLKQSNETRQGTLKSEFKFPINTDQELDTIEMLVKNKEHFDNLVSYIKKQGGRDISNKVSRVMKLIFTDQIAEQFNFYGKRSNKKPFSQLRLRDCVVDGVVATSSGATAKEVEDFIKIWLKHAPERLKKSKSINKP